MLYIYVIHTHTHTHVTGKNQIPFSLAFIYLVGVWGCVCVYGQCSKGKKEINTCCFVLL